jgi:hypothetical protein
MIAVGYKTQRLTTKKSALWVRFTSPPEFVGRNIQLYPKSLEPQHGPARGDDFSILNAIPESHPHAVTLRDLGMNEASSSKITALLLRHFSEISKPRESVPAAYDDHGLAVDNAVEADLHLLFLPPKQSDEENDSIPLRTEHCGSTKIDENKEKQLHKSKCAPRAVLIRAVIDRIQAQQETLLSHANHDKAATFRLSPKPVTLDTLYVHQHPSPDILASIKTVLLAPMATPAPKEAPLLPPDDPRYATCLEASMAYCRARGNGRSY